MENNEESNPINEDKENLSRKFLKIKNVKVFSNAYNLRIKEGDIIVGLNGEYYNSTYEDLKKLLDEDEEDKPHGTGAASPAESQDEASSDTSFSMTDKECNMCNKPCKFGFASIKDGVNGFKTVHFCGQEACLAGFSFNK